METTFVYQEAEKMPQVRLQDMDLRDYLPLEQRLAAWGAWARQNSEGDLRDKCITGEIYRRANGIIIDEDRDYIAPAEEHDALRMERYLAKLRARHYAVIELRYKAGLGNNEDIAYCVGRTSRTVRRWYYIAREHLYEMGA